MATQAYCVEDVMTVDHELTQLQIETSETPFFKIGVEVKEKKHLCYMSSESHGLFYPPKTDKKNLSVIMKIVKLEKQGDSDQHSYVISNLVVKNTNLKVTEEHSGSKAVRFENMPEEMFHQSQLFKLRKHTSSETKFALYTTEGHKKIYYLKPESGAIVAEESSSPDSYYYFSMSKYIEYCDDFGVIGRSYSTPRSASQLLALLQESQYILVALKINHFLETDTRQRTLFDSLLPPPNHSNPVPFSYVLRFTRAGGRGEMKFTCMSKVLRSSYSLNTTGGAVVFQDVQTRPIFQFEAKSSSASTDIIMYESDASGTNHYLTLIYDETVNPYHNLSATTSRDAAATFAVHQVIDRGPNPPTDINPAYSY